MCACVCVGVREKRGGERRCEREEQCVCVCEERGDRLTHDVRRAMLRSAKQCDGGGPPGRFVRRAAGDVLEHSGSRPAAALHEASDGAALSMESAGVLSRWE